MDLRQNEHFRNELKYICSAAELEILRVRLDSVMKLDSHTDERGWYTIRSIYFDDLQDTFFHENEDGTSPREKWRIRSYNSDPGRITLECKRKEHGMISKTSALLTYDQYQALVAGQRLPIGGTREPVLNRFLGLQQTRNLQPKVIVAYQRRPYVCRLGNVRVTFDCNIASSPAVDDFFAETLVERPVLPAGMHLLEVKYDAYIPDVIYRIIQMTNMQQVTFSKYYLCRKFSLGGYI